MSENTIITLVKLQESNILYEIKNIQLFLKKPM